MTNREQIEQAIISAGVFNGNDTEVLLSEVEKLYYAKDTVVEVIELITSEKSNSKTYEEMLHNIVDIIIKHGEKLENDKEREEWWKLMNR